RVPDNWTVFDNSALAHELGHVVQRIELENDAVVADCSWGEPKGLSSHAWDSTEWQGCASQEGWADFVAAATFFTRRAAAPVAFGHSVETGACSGFGAWSESNYARMFWDVYDTRNEANDAGTM